jgi:hypothetical protein
MKGNFLVSKKKWSVDTDWDDGPITETPVASRSKASELAAEESRQPGARGTAVWRGTTMAELWENGSEVIGRYR